MTGRERALMAFRHEQPDRTPFFEKLIKSPIADLVLGRPCVAENFVTRMEMMEAGDWKAIVEGEARDIAELVKRLGMDLVRLGTNLRPDFERPRRTGEWTWETSGEIIRHIPGSPWTQRTPKQPRSPEQHEADVIAGLQVPWRPSAPSDDEFYVLRRVKELLAAEGLEPAVFVSLYVMPVCALPRLMLEWFFTHRDLLHEYYARQSRWALGMIPRVVALGADIVGLGGDFAHDGGPLISPAHYREFVLPHIREQARAAHALGVFTTTASDGDLWPVIGDVLIASEVDGYEEIDVAAGMDLRRLKARCGDRRTFIGNVDVRFVLCRGTPDETRVHVNDVIDAGWGNGGHVLMSSNCIHEDVRAENFRAYMHAYRERFGITGLPPVFAWEPAEAVLPGYVIR
jgi:uroporphyrinogen decarboxylase